MKGRGDRKSNAEARLGEGLMKKSGCVSRKEDLYGLNEHVGAKKCEGIHHLKEHCKQGETYENAFFFHNPEYGTRGFGFWRFDVDFLLSATC